MSLYTTPGGSHLDEAHVCDAYNEGFNSLIEVRHVHDLTEPSYTKFAFMDCDASPLLCDYFHVGAVMLIRLETKMSSRMVFEPDAWPSCSTKWSLIGLPLKKMPFSKQVKIGRNIMPVFPSADEQLAAMVSLDGSVEGIELTEDAIHETIVEEVGSWRYPSN